MAPLSYRDAGVDIDAADQLVERIAPLARATRTPEVVADVGGFAGLCTLPQGLREPVLVSGTDGVGTKLEVAFATGRHNTVGIDLVAMCVNDVVTTGARPLFFLDYLATGKLDVDVAEAVVRGVAAGCTQAGCALLGGETAELPGMVPEGQYELAGFAVGVVERANMLGGARTRPGDLLVALGSSGLHSNGYSLVRRILRERQGLGWDAVLGELGCTVADALLRPTRIYAAAVAALAKACGAGLHALSHITGGGLRDNLPRALAPSLAARIHLDSYPRPPLFQLLQQAGPVEEDEMRRTFNLGVGLVAVVAAEAADCALDACRQLGEEAWLLGEVEQARTERAIFD